MDKTDTHKPAGLKNLNAIEQEIGELRPAACCVLSKNFITLRKNKFIEWEDKILKLKKFLFFYS